MATHTPGPWSKHAWRDGTGYFVAPPDGRAIYLSDVLFSDERTEEELAEAEANAQLIAAAPELLAALDALMSAVIDDNVHESAQSAMRVGKALQASRTAINKAEGR